LVVVGKQNVHALYVAVNHAITVQVQNTQAKLPGVLPQDFFAKVNSPLQMLLYQVLDVAAISKFK